MNYVLKLTEILENQQLFFFAMEKKDCRLYFQKINYFWKHEKNNKASGLYVEYSNFSSLTKY